MGGVLVDGLSKQKKILQVRSYDEVIGLDLKFLGYQKRFLKFLGYQKIL